MNWIEQSSSISVPRQDLLTGHYNRVELDPNGGNPIRAQLITDVFGQDEAVDAVTSAIMRSEAGFMNPNRPKGVFMFPGPTGVGKTEMAKALTRFLYPEDWYAHFRRIDCTDYTDSSSVNNIKGSTKGYVGYGDPLPITPDFLDAGGVIAFDEIEKADHSLHRWLLPILEEGTATVPLPTDKPAANGIKNSNEIAPTTLDFRNSYIVMTSNVGADEVHLAKSGTRDIGFGNTNNRQGDIKSAALKALKKHFAAMPEFLGRIGEKNSIVFKDLDASVYDKILDKFIEEINQNQRGSMILIATTTELRSWLIEQALKGSYGARTLRDLIDTLIVGQAAELKYTRRLKTGILIADINEETGSVEFWSDDQRVVNAPVIPRDEVYPMIQAHSMLKGV